MPPERIHPALSRPRTRLRPLSKDQFAPAPQGQGYAREALRAVLEYAFEPPDGLDRARRHRQAGE